MFVVILRHLEDVGRVCHKDITTVFVGGHILGFAFFEGFAAEESPFISIP